MSESIGSADPAAIVRQLQDATNAHDIEAIVTCFAPDYRNETPVHPARGFVGSEQVRRNWTQILAAIPDISTSVLASVVSGATVWSEWEHRGTRPDGTAHVLRGVIVFTVDDGLITAARFFLEPVDSGAVDVDTALRHQISPGSAP